MKTYYGFYVGQEALFVCLALMNGSKKPARDDEKVQAKNIKEAFIKITGFKEFVTGDLLDTFGDYVALGYTEGHEGWLIIAEEVLGALKIKAKWS